MLGKHRPATVIVATRDCDHDEYICRALEAGCDVITEKPMTIDERRCQRIIDAVKRTGRQVRVTFNCRYSPARSQIKQLLLDGVIGTILSVNLSWCIDTNHGADYFRRWHSHKRNSGGLLVHKATHHFDLVNWWVESVPKTVFARGTRAFYTADQARRYGLEKHADRCVECELSDRCNFYLDMRAFPTLKELYFDTEKQDGYIRDRCVFRDDVDIEDTVGLVAQYRNGVVLTYSLNAFMPWEGYRLDINGTKGRLEQLCRETSYIDGDGTVQGAGVAEGTVLKAFPHFKTPYEIPVWRSEGAHGGGDIRMLDDLFLPPQPDPLERSADYVHGAFSALTGIAANKSMETGSMICIDDLVTGLPDPTFAAAGTFDEHIPYVSDARLMEGGIETKANVPRKVFSSDSTC
jgi:predicted dehydrogenase